MLRLSIRQYNESRDSDVKEAARLSIGFLAFEKNSLILSIEPVLIWRIL